MNKHIKKNCLQRISLLLLVSVVVTSKHPQKNVVFYAISVIGLESFSLPSLAEVEGRIHILLNFGTLYINYVF